MSEEDISADIEALLGEIVDNAERAPVYTLLLCRKVTEAILMKKHLELINEGEPKSILTLGDLNNPKLGLKDQFDPLEVMSIQYIQTATNAYLHYRTNPPDFREDLVKRVLDELRPLLLSLGIEIPASKNMAPVAVELFETPDEEIEEALPKFDWMEFTTFRNKVSPEHIQYISKKKITLDWKNIAPSMSKMGWKHILMLELSVFEWPKLGETVLGTKNISGRINRTKHRRGKLRRKYKDGEIEEEEFRFRGNRLESNMTGWLQLRHMPKGERMDLIKKATESLLIAFYNEVGGEGYSRDYVDMHGPLTNSIFSVIDVPGAEEKEKWDFIIESQVKKKSRMVRMRDEWRFMSSH